MRRPSIGAGGRALPLSALTPSTQRFVANVRVTSKSAKTSFKKRAGGGDGAIFSCVLMDQEGVQISAKFWDVAAEEWSEKLAVGKVYAFANGKLKVANKKYNTAVDHNYEMHYDASNVGDIRELSAADQTQFDAESSRKVAKVNYTSFRAIEHSTRQLPYIVNVLGVVHAFQPRREVMARGELLKVRNVTLVDATGYALEVAVWNEDVDQSTLDSQATLSITNLQIREANRGGKSGSTGRNSELLVSPDCEEAAELAKWYAANAHSSNFAPLATDALGASAKPARESSVADIQEILETAVLADPESNALHRLTGSVVSVLYKKDSDDSQNLIYMACNKCNRKVANSIPLPKATSFSTSGDPSRAGEGEEEALSSLCDKCGIMTETVPRIATSVVVGDRTGSGLLVRIFNDQAVTIFGLNAQQLCKLYQADQGAASPATVEELCTQKVPYSRYTFVIRLRQDNYNGEDRISTTLVSVSAHTPRQNAANAIQTLSKLVPNIFDAPPPVKRIHLHQTAAPANSAATKPSTSASTAPPTLEASIAVSTNDVEKQDELKATDMLASEDKKLSSPSADDENRSSFTTGERDSRVDTQDEQDSNEKENDVKSSGQNVVGSRPQPERLKENVGDERLRTDTSSGVDADLVEPVSKKFKIDDDECQGRPRSFVMEKDLIAEGDDQVHKECISATCRGDRDA